MNSYGAIFFRKAVKNKETVYEGYIAALSTRKLYDECGNPHYCVDETLRRRLETKLITKILAFEVA